MTEIIIQSTNIPYDPSKPRTANFTNLTGRRIGRWIVLSIYGRDPRGKLHWLCLCECGQFKCVARANLQSGQSLSCGCLRLEQKVTHGASRYGQISPEYSVYQGAKRRCNNGTAYYGEKGIEFRFNSFEEFLAEVGPRPSLDYSLDRFPNNEGHYEPGNVRWATRTEQSRNRADRTPLTANGQTLLLCEWSKIVHRTVGSLFLRLVRGWCPECTVNIPVQKGGPSKRCTHLQTSANG